MGTHVIRMALYPEEAEAYAPAEGRTFEATAEGVLVADPALTDEECASVFEDYVPKAFINELDLVPDDMPDSVRNHLQHLRDYRDADPSAITNVQTVHVVQDLIRALFYTYRRFENEG